MTKAPDINFKNIRPYEGDVRKGFEELVCQLARRQPPLSTGALDRRVEGSGGDGGVEFYWILPDGSEHGFQAKYFLNTKDIDWRQIDKSVTTALKQHPKLTSYTIALACDLTDRSGKTRRSKKGWEHWETHKINWEELASTHRLKVEFIPWTKSDLIDQLVSKPENAGLSHFWFNARIFTPKWFKTQLDHSIAELGDRFQPEDHVELEIKSTFEGLVRSLPFLQSINRWFKGIPSPDKLLSKARKIGLPINTDLSGQLESSWRELNQCGDDVGIPPSENLPADNWAERIKAYDDALATISKLLNVTEDIDETDRREAYTLLETINGALATNTPLQGSNGRVLDRRINADKARSLFIVGEAGIGKSHLLTDVSKTLVQNNAPSVLVLGQNISGNNLRDEILQSLDLKDTTFSNFLSTLSVSAELAGQRALIIIDAINEARNLQVLSGQLAGLIHDIQQHPWLALVISLRPEYEKLINSSVLEQSFRLEHRGIQSPKEQLRAVEVYFDKRGITRPATPWLAPEFSNFLFLKTCCDALKEMGKHEFPKGLHGSIQVLKFYIKSTYLRLNRIFPDCAISPNAVMASLKNVGADMATNHQDYVTRKKALEICKITFENEGPSPNKLWFDTLVEEGLFRKDHDLSSSEEPFEDPEVIYRFTYQRFSDHFIVFHLLDSISDVDKAFDENGSLDFMLNSNSLISSDSLWTALAIQIPEKFEGKELPDSLPKSHDFVSRQYFIQEAFKESLLWRKETAFSPRTIKLFNALENDYRNHKIEVLLQLSATLDHPLNAEYLHNLLISMPLPERDSFWTVEINSITDDKTHPLWELLNWGLQGNLEHATEETLQLTAKTLIWALTSSSRPIRDHALKSLVSIFSARPKIIPGFFNEFYEVNDLYVLEGICLATLGAIVRLKDPSVVRTISKTVYNLIFSQEPVPLHLTLRDYARAIIQYSSYIGQLDSDVDLRASDPTYQSDWPLDDHSEDELETLADSCGGTEIIQSAYRWGGDFGTYEIPHSVHHFSGVTLDESKPLNADEIKKDFGREITTWPKHAQEAYQHLTECIRLREKSKVVEMNPDQGFGFSISYPERVDSLVSEAKQILLDSLQSSQTKIFKDKIENVLFPKHSLNEIPDLPKFDAEFAKRWITHRTYSLGWSKKLFPDDSGTYNGRQRPTIERIGKKYQWLALQELLARLSDNVWEVQDYPTRACVYDHPATDWFLRSVEPSILKDPHKKPCNEQWWRTINLSLEPIAHDDLRTWPFRDKDLARTEFLESIDDSGKKWLVLYGFEHKTEESITKPIGRDAFVRITTILVDRDKASSFVKNLQNTQLADPSGHETIDWTDGAFLCEYPWRNTWGADASPFTTGKIGEAPEKISYIQPVATHVWESHLDQHLPKGSSTCLLHPWIARQTRVKPNFDILGELVDSGTGKTVFLDPSVGSPKGTIALVDPEFFRSFLSENSLDCIWIIAGERNSYPSSSNYHDYSCRRFTGVYRLEKEHWLGDSWVEDSPNLSGCHSFCSFDGYIRLGVCWRQYPQDQSS